MHWLVAQDICLHFIIPHNCDGDRQRDILETKHIFTIALLVHCLYQMSPLNHKRTTGSLAPPISYVAKKWQFKNRRCPIHYNISQFQMNESYERRFRWMTLSLVKPKKRYWFFWELKIFLRQTSPVGKRVERNRSYNLVWEKLNCHNFFFFVLKVHRSKGRALFIVYV